MLSLRIALRYLLSRKSHGAVNVISAISVAGVAVAAAAIVVVLSVFNGFADLAASHFSYIDPDLSVMPVNGKLIAGADSLASSLEHIDGVAATTPVLQERGLLAASDGSQLGVVFKGVPDNYTRVVPLDSAIQVRGEVEPAIMLTTMDVPAQAMVGVASQLGLNPGTGRAELFVPRRVGRINPANPTSAFFSQGIVVENILAVNQMEIDADHLYIPLATARQLLMCYDSEASAIELRTAPGADIDKVRQALQQHLGPAYTVATRAMQHEESYRMIAVEKWVTFAMLIFILVIAAFNIVSTLSLMVIEKRDNMATLRFIGASRATVRAVFMWMGALITLAGGMLGIALGTALCAAQQYGGFIHLNADPSKLVVSVYPVRVAVSDLLAVLAIIIVMSALTSLVTRIFTRK